VLPIKLIKFVAMQFKRTLIALSLLFAYSLGFAHELLPHCHHSDGVAVLGTENSEHSHQHNHQHDHADVDSDHEHVAHADHFDDGLMDFILCLLAESNHSSSHADHCFDMPAERTAVSFSAWDKIKLVATFAAVFAEKIEETTVENFVPEVNVAFLSPPLAYSVNRGPPTAFCLFA
jgi:hypothetical protein